MKKEKMQFFFETLKKEGWDYKEAYNYLKFIQRYSYEKLKTKWRFRDK